jgi:hypothetical protein
MLTRRDYLQVAHSLSNSASIDWATDRSMVDFEKVLQLLGAYTKPIVTVKKVKESNGSHSFKFRFEGDDNES